MSTSEISVYRPDTTEMKLWRPPEQVLVEAQQAAVALQKRIAAKTKPVIFNQEQYLEFEDWEMLGHFYGYVPKVESVEFVEFGDVRGFKASALLVNEHSGVIVSRAESMCLNDEDNWGMRSKYEWQDVVGPDGKKQWKDFLNGGKGGYAREKVVVDQVPTPLFQLMSMAQTRACAKVYRNKLAWVVVLAGYKATPAEELTESTMPQEHSAEPIAAPLEIKRKEPVSVTTPQVLPPKAGPVVTPRPVVQSPKPAAGRVISEPQSRRFYAIYKQAGRTNDEVKAYLQEHCGVTDSRQIPADPKSLYENACAWAEGKEAF